MPDIFRAGPLLELAMVDVAILDPVIAWVKSVPLEDWPQQSNLHLKPAMVNTLSWNGFGAQTDALVASLMKLFPGSTDFQRMLSVVMPAERIPAHTDRQIPNWLCRVHVPLVATSGALFQIDDGDDDDSGLASWSLRVGMAYIVDVTATHAVENHGLVPRIHFMFDVTKPTAAR